MGTEDFNRHTIEAVAKRAGTHCSNPDCFALTSGPADDDSRFINVGEAAHIFGARPNSARYNVVLSDADRADVTNAIWLCRNCHKMVDADAVQFPAELLFEWRRAHEQVIMESLGKAGALMRQKVLQKKLAGFENCSYLAQQIIIDRPRFWEQKLTAEILRSLLEPIKLRWEALEKGLYVLPSTSVSVDEYLVWSQTKLNLMSGQAAALSRLVTDEIERSWGPPGLPGSETEIYRICSLISESCHRLLQCEETIRFTIVPEVFQEVQALMVGTAGVNILKVFEIPIWLTNIFSQENPSGAHHLNIVFDLPPNWAEDVNDALQRAAQNLGL